MWELIDTDGFAFGAKAICATLHPPRTVEVDRWHVTPGTQVNCVLAFPELEDGQQIAYLLLNADRRIFRFEIAPMNPEAAQLLRTRVAAAAAANGYAASLLTNAFDQLERMINARLHHVLSPAECVRAENEVRQHSFVVRQRIRGLPGEEQVVAEAHLADLLADYEGHLNAARATDDARKGLEKTVERLYELSPREFERYIAELFRALGYDRVTLGRGSGDLGVDILVDMDGARTAIQCKRYKGLVGSPEIQGFLGAMRHAEAGQGIFVTTGVFSIEAQNMASAHPIELVDKYALGRLIAKAMGRPGASLDVDHPSNGQPGLFS